MTPEQRTVQLLKQAGHFAGVAEPVLTGFAADQPCSFTTGLVVTVWNRPEYLLRTLESLADSCLDDCLVVIVDDASDDELARRLAREASLPAPAIRLVQRENRGVGHCLEVGWTLLHGWGCRRLVNLDSDVLVKPHWLSVLAGLHERLDFSADRLILSGFNRHNNPSILSSHADHVVKLAMGGVNYYFDTAAYDLVRGFLGRDHWDTALQRHFQAHRFEGYTLVAARPSVVQHIGQDGINSHPQRYDYASDFDLPEASPTRYVISRRQSGLGDCLVSLFSAWLFARATGRTLVVDWRLSAYRVETGDTLFAHLFEPVDEIGGVPVLTRIDAIPVKDTLTICPPSRRITDPRRPVTLDPQELDNERREMLDRIRFATDVDEDVVIMDSCLNWDEMLATSVSAQFFSALKPVAAVRQAVEDFHDRHFGGRPLVGVHIRHDNGGDMLAHGESWDARAVERCVTMINRVRVALGGSCDLFLASDSPVIEQQFALRFPDLVTRPKYLRPAGHGELHHCPDGEHIARDALVEIQLLARADVLIRFPRGSFFSRVAAAIRSGGGDIDNAVTDRLATLQREWARRGPGIEFGAASRPASFLLTFRDDGNGRLENLYFVLDHLAMIPETEIALVEQDGFPKVDPGRVPRGCRYRFVENPGAFNKSWGFNLAANLSSGEVLVFHDADMLIDVGVMQAAIEQVGPEVDALNPYDMLIDLDREETGMLLRGDPSLEISRTLSETNRIYLGEQPPFCGGVFLLRREFFYAVGGMDERFRGWGGEDNAMEFRIRKASVNLRTFQGQVAYHLWHEIGPHRIHSAGWHDNLARLSAYTLPVEGLVTEMRQDLHHNADTEKYAPAVVPDRYESLPLVTCLCVTRGRVGRLQRAVSCFQWQTYPHCELLIVYEDDDVETADYAATVADPRVRVFVVPASRRLTLGALRNVAIEQAHGEYVCQWDDDDWYDPARISRQLSVVREQGKAACVLSRWTLFAESTGQLAICNARLWEGSLLCRRDVFGGELAYADRSRGEDSVVVGRLLARNELAVTDQPDLYIYCVHEENTWNPDHFAHMSRYSTSIGADRAALMKKKMAFDGSPGAARIPAILHQTAASDVLPEDLRALQQSLWDQHPQWDYRFYDDNRCRQIVAERMPELLDCYDRLPTPIQRADLFRLVVVYLDGGFYLDLDMEIHRPFDELRDHQCVFAEELTLTEARRLELGHRDALRIANFMFGARPRDEFIRSLILDIAHQAPRVKVVDESDVLETTGPGVITRCFHDLAPGHVTVVENPGNVCPVCSQASCWFGSYARHKHVGSWRWQGQDDSDASRQNEDAPARIIHQTWKTARLPDLYSRLAMGWRSVHPDWQYVLWTDTDNRNLVAEHYPWFLEAYDRFPHPIQRVDAARYLILYSVGGLYVDLDFAAVRAVDPILGSAGLVLGVEHPDHGEIHGRRQIVGNAFIYARHPGHPFLRKVIEEMTRPPAPSGDTNTDVLASTGPLMLTRVYESFENRSDIRLLPYPDLYPLDYRQAALLRADKERWNEYMAATPASAVHLYTGSWWQKSVDDGAID